MRTSCAAWVGMIDSASGTASKAAKPSELAKTSKQPTPQKTCINAFKLGDFAHLASFLPARPHAFLPASTRIKASSAS